MKTAVKDVMTAEVVAVRVLGVVSEADLLAKETLADPGLVAELVPRKAGGLTAGELMTRPPVTATPDDPIEQVARISCTQH